MAIHVRRREFIFTLGGAAVAWPLTARAQQPATPVIGFLSLGSPETNAHLVAAFRKGLGEIGYIEGRNVTVEFRWANGRNDRLPTLATDLIRRQVAVLVAVGGSVTAQAAKAATATIPIVFAGGGDPVALGLVTSLNHPGGNATGAVLMSTELEAKRLELLREAVPKADAFAMFVNPTSPNAEYGIRIAQEVERATGRKVHILNASSERDIDAAFAGLARLQVGGLLVGSDAFFNTRRDQLVALAAHYRVPAMYDRREFPVDGGLMSYGPLLTETFHQVGLYTGRILKGEKPADLPVMQPTKFELVINLKTAKALGITIPSNVLALADEVIE
jgi:putative ABC transport system substrate-binding protein